MHPQDADFRPRFPWFGADLQTLRNFLRRPRHDLSPWPLRRLRLDLDDGSGDCLTAALHQPESGRPRPLIVLVHGLAGCEDSIYIRASARHLLSAGYPVLRLNLRGAGSSRPLCRAEYHAGRSEDLRAGLKALAAARPLDQTPGIFLCGYSLGANMLLKFLGEFAGATPQGLPHVQGAVAVSAPIDLKASQIALMRARNKPYQRYLLGRMRAEFLATPVPLTAAERAEIEAARTLYEFDDRIVAPRNGFDGADHYYAVNSACHALPGIDTPTLVVQALDDPWIPAKVYLEQDWAANPSLRPVLSRFGGHVGFHGRGSPTAWHDTLMLAFIQEVG